MSRFNDARIINDVEVKEIFIAAITTPTPSTKQIETSCTAGFDREGRWVRVYPVPLRLIEARTGNGYRKYQWVRFNTFAARADDKRPESRKCSSDFQCITEPSKSWEEKKSICLGKGHRIYTDFSELYDEAFSEKMTSLAVFKPASIIRCHAEDISQRQMAADAGGENFRGGSAAHLEQH